MRRLHSSHGYPGLSVGRMIEQRGKLRAEERAGFGHDQVRLAATAAWNIVGEILESTVAPVIGSTRLPVRTLPALSCHVWKCEVSVGPMLSRMRSTSALVTLCASEGYRLLPPCSMKQK